jgi:NAD(P)-dependent dehydrogenase (short-subunit alcohol dehydrogenase family)
VSSLVGRFGYPNRVGYSTTKWGLAGLAKTLAMEPGPLGITSNTVHPCRRGRPRIMSMFQGRAAVLRKAWTGQLNDPARPMNRPAR